MPPGWVNKVSRFPHLKFAHKKMYKDKGYT